MPIRLRVLDLFAGLGGFSQAFRVRGHEVFTVDIVPPADLIADVRTLAWGPGRFDLVLAAPPCDEFSRESMPWCATGKKPSVVLVHEALRAVNETRPKFWLLENVRGARAYIDPVAPYWGRTPNGTNGGRFFWGKWPAVQLPPEKGKERTAGQNPRERSRVSYDISLALCEAVERALQ